MCTGLVILARRVIECPKSGKLCPTGHLKSCPDHISESTGPIFMIPRPLESSGAVDVHWLGHFSEAHNRVPEMGQMCPTRHLKSCPDHISETTGLIFMIPRRLVSSRAVDVHWLGHFREARNRVPEIGQNVPNRALEILS